MFKNHIIPKNIKDSVVVALDFYPQLQDIHIEFKVKKNIKKSTMQARPTFDSFFKKKKDRKYLILISKKFKISGKEFSTLDIPDTVFIGWIGHELGHIMDYQHRNRWNLIWFGIKYLFSENHIVEAERVADRFAVQHKMEDYILKTKNFILNHADITEKYKNRMRRYYLSPEEIMFLVQERDRSSNV
jgi:hypothetical protein